MIERLRHLAGTPCWVDTLQPDPLAATEFYGPLLGWSFDDAVPAPRAVAGGDYYTARLGGHRVAGVGQAPPGLRAAWLTHIRVDDIESAISRAEAAGGACLAAPAAGAGTHGRAAVLTDATGVPFCVQEAGESAGAEVVDGPGTWAMSSLHSTDMAESRRFYGAVFGWELDPVPGAPFSKWHLGGHVVGLLTEADGVSTPQHWSVNFTVRDADAVAEHALALGGTAVLAPFDTPGFRNTVIADPQGGVVALSARTS
ncbi:VOC family protein [Georgenia subflava]|uniref:VOC family protein n=1 Tax=Georgenia subflava TaxID=1622177 RepID=A0A6N7EK26_9MICO|nr:VOC family protein [Georgenia subflava]MPV35634.1 VOC family protein [Georgenia subflava]